MRIRSESIKMNSSYVLILIFLAAANSSVADDQCSTVDECVGSSVAALVPARSGSKGIKHKNLSRIGNETLLARSLTVIHRTRQFDSVWVSTDGKEIADEALSHGAQVHWRDPATATDEATTVSAVKEFLHHHKEIDVLAVIQCTSPFLKADFLVSAFRTMTHRNLSCIFSATRVYNLRWVNTEDGFVKPINFDPRNRPRRQDWSGELIENGMFYLADKRLILEQGVLQNNRCGVYEVPKEFSIEIDTEQDLTLARALAGYLDTTT